ncbi:lipopolysaccharide biosynthesis protein [Microbacterium aurantiacum]|uniref:lipopolysaccharide biosynthesis protein n=1 Tax=Microbacterium aurantiacum TaxID=162393 RepID=UPI001F169E1C|nr:lipopolysaccharide biosynthesis protein [Microbacterium aurantiacum]
MTDLSLRRRLVGFMLLPALAAVSPLVVLPLVARTAGPGGWASAIAGESVGTFAAIVIGYGWAAIGPALISIAADDDRRARLYRESIVVRAAVALVTLPVLAVICWLISSPGAEWLTILMGVQGALIALSFTWYCAGVGDPRTIIIFDAVPRLVATIVAAFAIAATGIVEVYPLSGILVTVLGTSAFTNRLLRRHPGSWPRARELPGLFRAGFPVALNDAALSAYSSVPAPLVNVTSPPVEAAGFASADKMFKLGSVLPFTLASALQSWVGEVSGPPRARRMRLAMSAHAGFGIVGGVVLASLGDSVSMLLFGSEAAAGVDLLIAMGIVFAFLSLRTSMTRHVLFPAGKAKTVMRATLAATAVGIPVMIIAANVIGPLGAAVGYAFTEAAATLLLWRPCASAVRAIERAEPIPPLDDDPKALS